MQLLPDVDPANADSLREACGVFGVWSPEVDVARLTFYGLYALQHRGQESAGICTTDGAVLHLQTGMGLVSQVFTEDELEPLGGMAAIGHTRYSTTGSSRFRNSQPIRLFDPQTQQPTAIAHNGNVVNAAEVRAQLMESGQRFQTSTDTEILGLYLLEQQGSWESRFSALMHRVDAAYSIVMLTPDRLMAARDPLGVRPLCVGKIEGGYVVASETCALDHIEAEYVREVRPGELVTIDNDGLRGQQVIDPVEPAGCVFEHIYFARPDSVLDGRLAYQSRRRMGWELAREHPADADIVIGVPDSATAHAVGYAEESGIPYSEGLVKNRYVGRTFIEPDQRARDLGARLKYNPMKSVLGGKRVVVIDDTIVRGTTTPRIVKLLRHAGALEVHMRISAPPIRHACFFGVDMATRTELIASQHSVEDVRRHINADSLGYLSIPGLLRALDLGKRSCLACFTGEYPVPVQLGMDKLVLERSSASQPIHLAAALR